MKLNLCIYLLYLVISIPTSLSQHFPLFPLHLVALKQDINPLIALVVVIGCLLLLKYLEKAKLGEVSALK